MKKIFIMLLLVLSYSQIFSVDTNGVKYAPIAVGNKWVFIRSWYVTFPPPPHWAYDIKVGEIIGDTIMNGERYFHLIGIEILGGWIRIDSNTGNLYQPESGCYHPFDLLYDSLASSFDDTSYRCSSPYDRRKYYSSTTTTIGGISYHTKYFQFVTPPGTTNKYARQLGFAGGTFGYVHPYFYDLKGCIINGVVIGDTSLTLVGVEKISNGIPFNHSLSQNYPNPFNPVTRIKYDVPPSKGVGGMMVQLIIYDVLGREIETLVNESKKPGSYEVQWDGSRFASDVYFYKLVTEEWSETRKMVLIK